MVHLWFTLLTLLITIGLFAAMLLAIEIGRRLGVRLEANRGPDSRVGVGVVDGSVYALLGLLIGFMFSGAAGRYDERRHLVADEVNAAGTAWLRIDLLPDEQQAPLRESFRNYLDQLLAWYQEKPGAATMFEQPPGLVRSQNELWSRAAAACLTAGGEPARMLLLPAMNELFDTVDKERMARRMHPPVIIFVMLGISALASAVFAGYGMASGTARNWIYMIGIAATVAIAVYVILELEYPRMGLFRIEGMDQALAELRVTMD